MRILVTFAVDAEFAPWRKRHNFECQLIDAPRISKKLLSYQGDVHGVVVDVFLTGIGWESSIYNAAREGLRVLFEARPDFCVTTGLAGALKPELELGSVVATIEVGVQSSDEAIKSSQYALAVARNCGAKIAHKLITCDHVVGNSTSKQVMGKFADIVDMESYFIMAVASGAQIPAIAVRAVSDGADKDLPLDFSKVTDRYGHLRVGRLVRELATKPGRIPALVAFGRQSRKAASNLADFLDQLVPSLGRGEGRVVAAAYGELASL
jgi:adenosylhomocysteine nucleosidase